MLTPISQELKVKPRFFTGIVLEESNKTLEKFEIPID
jgi:hypothetical protein